MKADRRHQITIKQNSKIQNALGQPTDNWVDVLTCWSSFEPILGNQYFAAEQHQSGVSVKFETEYASDITRDMRVKHDNILYDIIGDPINVRGLNRDMILYCGVVKL